MAFDPVLKQLLDNLSAAISTVLARLGGGTKNIFNSAILVGTTATTILSVTGSGVLFAFSGSSSLTNVTITVDGTVIYNAATVQDRYLSYTLVDGFLRFNSSLTITAIANSSTYNFFAYYLTGV